MKKKHLNIVLLILVLVIYGGVFLKIFGKKQIDIEGSKHSFTFNSPLPETDIVRNNFDISKLEKDPFNIDKKRKKRILSTKPKVNTSSRASKKTNLKEPWPKVNYYGFVKNDINSTKLALLKLDNTLYRKREGEVVGEITIIKVYSDSIKLKFKNEPKIIARLYE